MPRQHLATLIIAAAILAPGRAQAQEDFSVNWHTIDCGGGPSTGEEWVIVATIAQPDAGSMVGPETGESFAITGGFWALTGAACYANCDNSAGVPLLTANDFTCFVNAFAAGSPSANCDGSTQAPTLTSNDFVCFVNAYAVGCPS